MFLATVFLGVLGGIFTLILPVLNKDYTWAEVCYNLAEVFLATVFRGLALRVEGFGCRVSAETTRVRASLNSET